MGTTCASFHALWPGNVTDAAKAVGRAYQKLGYERLRQAPVAGCKEVILEILCHAAVAIEPSERSLDNPAAWQQLKPSRVSCAFDDLNGLLAEPGEGVIQLGPL
jgi:hypothetical protein